MKNKTAFTLIEILIVVGVVMLIMVSISGIMSGVFTSQNKNKASDKITQNGSWILNELKKNVINADKNGENGGQFTCPDPGPGTSITIINVKDKEKVKTIITCFDSIVDGYKIASISSKTVGVGTTVYLFEDKNDLVLESCSNFVSCSTSPSLQLSNVNFNFTLKAGVDGLSSGTTKSFSMDVTLRN
jgi:type II secretory pathway pseudopilin PulG